MRKSTLFIAAAAASLAAAPAFAGTDWNIELNGPVSGPLVLGTVGMTEEMTERAQQVGPDEVQEILTDLGDEVAESFERAGYDANSAQAVTVNLYLDNAEPNRPTQWQLSGRGDFGDDDGPDRNLGNSGLSLRSIALGEVEIIAEFVSAEGQSLGTIEYEYEPFDISDVKGYATWTAVHRGIDRFASGLPKKAAPVRGS